MTSGVTHSSSRPEAGFRPADALLRARLLAFVTPRTSSRRGAPWPHLLLVSRGGRTRRAPCRSSSRSRRWTRRSIGAPPSSSAIGGLAVVAIACSRSSACASGRSSAAGARRARPPRRQHPSAQSACPPRAARSSTREDGCSRGRTGGSLSRPTAARSGRSTRTAAGARTPKGFAPASRSPPHPARHQKRVAQHARAPRRAGSQRGRRTRLPSSSRIRRPRSCLSRRARAVHLPGLRIEALPVRSYPQGGLGSEFLGLLGEIQPQQLESRRYGHARPGQLVGQSGVEATYDALLNGGFRRARLRVDSRGRIVGPAPPARPCLVRPTLRLTIDARINGPPSKRSATGSRSRTAPAIPTPPPAPPSSSILATARCTRWRATPAWQLLASHDPAYLALLKASPAPPLLNRATQGLYPTGSTFKPIVAEAGLATGLITPTSTIPCTGSFTIRASFHNVEAGINEMMNLTGALGVVRHLVLPARRAPLLRQARTGSLDISAGQCSSALTRQISGAGFGGVICTGGGVSGCGGLVSSRSARAISR